MSKATAIATMSYKKPAEVKSLRGLLKYLQFRDGSLRREAYLRDGRYPEGLSDADAPLNREPIWADRGLGEGYREIIDRAHGWQGKHVLARSWVISPDPELIEHVPADERPALVARLTERTVERWYADNGWGQPDYSYVVHDKHRVKDGFHMPHAHVITPGTVPVDTAGSLGRIDHIVTRAHLRDLQSTIEETFGEELVRVLDRERAAQIIRQRDKRIEKQRREQNRSAMLGRLRALADINQLLAMEKAARNRKANRARARRLSAELHAASRYARSTRRQRRDADRVRVQAAQEQAHDLDLQTQRDRHRERVEDLQRRHKRIPTHAERRERDEQDQQAVANYYAALLADRGELQRDPTEQERER